MVIIDVVFVEQLMQQRIPKFLRCISSYEENGLIESIASLLIQAFRIIHKVMNFLLGGEWKEMSDCDGIPCFFF